MDETGKILYKESNKNFNLRLKYGMFQAKIILFIFYILTIISIFGYFLIKDSFFESIIVVDIPLTILMTIVVFGLMLYRKRFTKLIVYKLYFQNPLKKKSIIKFENIKKIKFLHYEKDYQIKFFYRNNVSEPIEMAPVIKKDASKLLKLFKELNLKIEY
jgi:hypothetical protein